MNDNDKPSIRHGWWRNKRVCITGGASFIASHLVERLLEIGVKDLLLIDDLSSGSIENLPETVRRHVIVGNLLDYDFALEAISMFGADVLLNLASYHGGRGITGFTSNDVMMANNFILDTNILKAAVNSKVEHYFFSSSACIYDIRHQNNQHLDFRIEENWETGYTALYPDGMYGLSKVVAERVFRSCYRDGLINGAIGRFFTVMGMRMKQSHFICASIAKSFIKTDPFYVWGSGDIVRNFTPVQNIVDGILLATEKGGGEFYNFGLERRITIDYALEKVWEYMGWRPNKIVYQLDMPVGIKNRVADCTKARIELGWSNKVDFEQSLQETIDWFVTCHTVKQVEESLEHDLVSR